MKTRNDTKKIFWSNRRYPDNGKSVAAAITATQYVLESFYTRKKTVNCHDITLYDTTTKWGMAKFFLTGKPIGCMNLAGAWVPEAIRAAGAGFSSEPKDIPETHMSCAAEVAKKMGASDEECAMVAGFAGGLGLSGNACGALAGAIWIKSLAHCREHPGNSPYPNVEAIKIQETFEKFTGNEFRCDKICGQRFKTSGDHAEKINVLKLQLISLIKAIKPDCIINSPEHDCLANTASITFPNMKSAGLMAMLDLYGIAVSGGSACSAQEEKPSHVLKSIGLSDQSAQETIRISLGDDTTEQDIRYVIKVLRNYFDGRTMQVNMITPAQFNDTILADEQTYILDVRPQFQRRILKSLPNSHEASFFQIEKYLSKLPKDKNILVVCQNGDFSLITAYYLKSKGFERVSNLVSGLNGIKMIR